MSAKNNSRSKRSSHRNEETRETSASNRTAAKPASDDSASSIGRTQLVPPEVDQSLEKISDPPVRQDGPSPLAKQADARAAHLDSGGTLRPGASTRAGATDIRQTLSDLPEQSRSPVPASARPVAAAARVSLAAPRTGQVQAANDGRTASGSAGAGAPQPVDRAAVSGEGAAGGKQAQRGGRTTDSRAKSLALQLHRISGKRQWMWWFGILTFLAIVLGGWRMPLIIWRDSSWISLVIFVLFTGALLKSWLDICFLDRETKLASRQVLQLQDSGDIGAFVQSARECLFKTHIASLHTIFRNDADIRQDNLVEVLHARLMARNKVVEMFASVLITLGLIGTIVGLIGSIGGLSEVLDRSSANSNALFSGMTRTVGGLETAFFTTLFGAVFGGVFLRILAGVVDANILNYTAHLAELTDVYVLPPMRRMAGRLQEAGFYRNLDGNP